MIWRQIEVPTSITLKVLHDVIQAVMGWFDHHLWEFTIAKRRYGLPMDEDWGRVEAAMTDQLRLSKSVAGKLGGYVYRLIDPRNGETLLCRERHRC